MTPEQRQEREAAARDASARPEPACPRCAERQAALARWQVLAEQYAAQRAAAREAQEALAGAAERLLAAWKRGSSMDIVAEMGGLRAALAEARALEVCGG